jgi:hypothetical protein
MLIDASHKTWVFACVIIAIVATTAYIPYWRLSLNGPSGGSWPGLLYGVGGSALMLYAGLLSVRKKIPTWRIGRAETWMRGHIWLGLLSLLLILFHSGFRFGGSLTTVLMILLLLIIASGIGGLVLQQFLPRLMMVQIPAETIYEQIDHVVDHLLAESDLLIEEVCGPLGMVGVELAGGGLSTARVKAEGKIKGKVVKSKVKRESDEPIPGSEPLKKFYLSEARPFLAKAPTSSKRLSTPQQAAATFDHLRTILPPPLHEVLDDLATACEERRQLVLQARLHGWLHGWLFVHIPLSMAVLILAIVHAALSLRY